MRAERKGCVSDVIPSCRRSGRKLKLPPILASLFVMMDRSCDETDGEVRGRGHGNSS